MADAKLGNEQIREEMAYSLGIQACLWGRPLCEYATTIYHGVKAGAGYMNAWHHFPALKTAKDRYVVTPNNVTINGYGNADVTNEPVVVNLPAISAGALGARWYIVQIGDMFDEIVYNIGGYKGAEPGLYILTAPDYCGKIPHNMREIKLDTYIAVVALRVFVNGEADLPNARVVQSGFHMLPLSAFIKQGLAYKRPEGLSSFPEFTANGPEELSRFEHIGFAMKLFLPTSLDFSDPLIVAFANIGLSVRHGFEWEMLDDATKRGLARAAVVADQAIDYAYAESATIVDGWRYTLAFGRSGHDLSLRAAFAKFLLGANVPEQLVYPNCAVDNQGNHLNGKHRYTLHFEKDQIPPASVLWNLAMYASDMLFIENEIDRYTIGSTTDGLKTNADGSITLYIQHKRPQEISNWLPAPEGDFNLTMRMYGAQTPVLDGTYHLPPVEIVNG